MAKVKYPLHSLSASGTVGKQVTFHKSGGNKPHIITRRRGDKVINAVYPRRRISGEGIARIKPGRRGDLRKRRPGENIPANEEQALREAQFRHATTITDWIVRNNIVVAESDPNNRTIPLRPWWDGLYFQRGQTSEERRFPGQGEGESLNIRRQITGATTKRGFISHQLLTRSLFRFTITLAAWRNLTPVENTTWLPGGDAPWEELPMLFPLPGEQFFTRTFANIWIQAAYLIPLFEMPRNWLRIGQRVNVWVSEHPRPDSDPAVAAFKAHLSAQNDYQIIDVESWQRP